MLFEIWFLGAGTACGVLQHSEYINKTLFNRKTAIIAVSAELRIDVFKFINDERRVDAVIAFNPRIKPKMFLPFTRNFNMESP